MKTTCLVLTAILTATLLTGPAWGQSEQKNTSQPLTPEQLDEIATYWTTNDDAATEGLVLSVRESVDMTLERNAQVLVAAEDVKAARAKIGQARSQMFPQVKASISMAHIDGLEIPSGLFGDILLGGAKQDIRTDNITISQVLYAGGQIRAAIQASRHLAQSEEWKRQATLNELEFQAKDAYYGCLLTRAIIRVAEESVKTFRRHLNDTEQMLEVGLVSNFEVLRAKTELGSRQADLVAARNGERLALVNLRRILALPKDTPLVLRGGHALEQVDQGVEELLSKALEARPELQALRKGIAAAGQNVKRSKGQYLPSAAATADWQNADGGGRTQPDGWTFGVGAEWDVCAGGRRKYEVAEAKAQLRSLEYQLTDLERLVELDVRSAYISMEDALARIVEQQGTVELGKEGRRLAELRFQEGVGTQAETLDADLALTSAETGLVQAIHEYAVALAAIDRATGRSWVASVAAE
ncbi:MAG: TolC family protein [Nitrospiraceae bacterium]|nr:TolC family protein [Nitrospiraceae bacterium]